MYKIKQTTRFSSWLLKLKDIKAKELAKEYK